MNFAPRPALQDLRNSGDLKNREEKRRKEKKREEKRSEENRLGGEKGKERKRKEKRRREREMREEERREEERSGHLMRKVKYKVNMSELLRPVHFLYTRRVLVASHFALWHTSLVYILGFGGNFWGDLIEQWNGMWNEK